MPAFNFQAQFAAAVESGKKRQTIRALRKDGRDPKVGDTLYLYTGMRTTACRKLGEAVVEEVWSVKIQRNRYEPVTLESHCISGGLADEFARADGFVDIFAMYEWFEKTHGLPFTGKLYRWTRVP